MSRAKYLAAKLGMPPMVATRLMRARSPRALAQCLFGTLPVADVGRFNEVTVDEVLGNCPHGFAPRSEPRKKSASGFR
jgi:hypothetical protein